MTKRNMSVSAHIRRVFAASSKDLKEGFIFWIHIRASCRSGSYSVRPVIGARCHKGVLVDEGLAWSGRILAWTPERAQHHGPTPLKGAHQVMALHTFGGRRVWWDSPCPPVNLVQAILPSSSSTHGWFQHSRLTGFWLPSVYADIILHECHTRQLPTCSKSNSLASLACNSGY